MTEPGPTAPRQCALCDRIHPADSTERCPCGGYISDRVQANQTAPSTALAQRLAEEIDNECLGLDDDGLECAVAAALRAIAEQAQADHAEWVRRNFGGSASQIVQSDPTMQSYNTESKVVDLMAALEQSVKDARAEREAKS